LRFADRAYFVDFRKKRAVGEAQARQRAALQIDRAYSLATGEAGEFST